MTFLRVATYVVLIGLLGAAAIAAGVLLSRSVPAAIAWSVLVVALLALYLYHSLDTARANAYLVEFELGSMKRVFVSETFEKAEGEYLRARRRGRGNAALRAGQDPAQVPEIVERGLLDSDIVFLPLPFYRGKHYPMTQITLHLDAVAQLTQRAKDSPPTQVWIDPSLILRFSPFLADLITTLDVESEGYDLTKETDIPYKAVLPDGTVQELSYKGPCVARSLLQKLREPAHDAIRTVVGQMTFEQVVLNPPDLVEQFLKASAKQELFRQARLLRVVGTAPNERILPGRSLLLIEYRVERMAFGLTLQEALQRPRLAALAAEARAHEGEGERRYLAELGAGEKAFLERVKETGVDAEQALASRTLRTVSSNVDIVFSDGGILGAAGARFLGRNNTP